MKGELRGAHLRRNPTKKREFLLPTLLLSIVTLRRVSGASHALVETRRREATRERAFGYTRLFGNDEFRREWTIFVRVRASQSWNRARECAATSFVVVVVRTPNKLHILCQVKLNLTQNM